MKKGSFYTKEYRNVFRELGILKQKSMLELNKRFRPCSMVVMKNVFITL